MEGRLERIVAARYLGRCQARRWVEHASCRRLVQSTCWLPHSRVRRGCLEAMALGLVPVVADYGGRASCHDARLSLPMGPRAAGRALSPSLRATGASPAASGRWRARRKRVFLRSPGTQGATVARSVSLGTAARQTDSACHFPIELPPSNVAEDVDFPFRFRDIVSETCRPAAAARHAKAH